MSGGAGGAWAGAVESGGAVGAGELVASGGATKTGGAGGTGGVGGSTGSGGQTGTGGTLAGTDIRITVGDVWSASFSGTEVVVYAPKESGAGTMEIQVDGQAKATADLSPSGARQPQQRVAEVTGLDAGTHTISIVNRGPGPVAVDAIVVK